MNDWAKTERLSARVSLAEGLAISGEIHLQPRVAWRDGPETPLEMLNREDAFFPLTLSGNDIVFVAKGQVAALAFSPSDEEQDVARQSAMRTIPLEIMLVGGSELRGVAVSELPPNRSRALDFLNDAAPFFLLVTADGHVCLNRRFVRAARPLS